MRVWVHKDDNVETKVGRYDMDVAPVVGDELAVVDVVYKVVRRRLTPWFDDSTGVEVWVEKM
jgi:hypothetical protein